MAALRYRYQTIEFGEIDIHFRTLRDRQQFDDPQGVAEDLGISSALWPMFGTVWPSGLVMANFMLGYKYRDKRILEVGCGIGLTSLLLNHLMADITATDYHPAVKGFLNKNTKLNDDKNIPFVLADWKDTNSKLGHFDLILASDLLYEREHAFLLSQFVGRHAKKKCDVVLVDPGRGGVGKFSREMSILGFSHIKSRPEGVIYEDIDFSGSIIEYHR